MRVKTWLSLTVAGSLLLAVAGCSTSANDAADSADAGGSGVIIDAAAERITDEQAAYLDELYQAAKEEGELVIYSGSPDDMKGVIALFESTFPGISVTASSLIGAPLVQALSAEQQSGNHVADVLHNPDAQLYVNADAAGNFGQPYEVQTIKVPEVLENSADSIVDPEHRFSTPFLGFFGLGSFLPRVEEAGGEPASFADLGNPKYAGLVGMGDPTVPGPQQAALLYLLNSGGLDEASLAGLGSNAVVKGDYGQAVGGLMQGEYPFMFGAPTSAVTKAAASGAPVKYTQFPSDNPLVTHKHVLLEGAPHESAGKLYIEFLNLFSAQQELAKVGFTPIIVEAADPEASWTSLTESGVTEIVSYQTIDASRATFLPLIEQAFAG